MRILPSRLQRFILTALLACGITAIALHAGGARAQVSPAGGGANSPPTAAKASSPSPETGRQLEPQLFGFIFVGGGILCAIGVVLADRRVRSDYTQYVRTVRR